jgi:hypothetical protein
MNAPVPVSATAKRRTITLTNRAPIQIVEDDWPVVAQGACSWDYPSDPGLGWKIEMRIRVHRLHNWRVIIHANYEYAWDYEDDERNQTIRVGRLLKIDTPQKIWKHILEIGEELRERISDDSSRKYVTPVLDQCFANLPALTSMDDWHQ